MVVSVFVPELPASEKPLFFKSKHLPQGAYRRIGSTDQQCTEDDLMVFYEGRTGEAYDTAIVTDADLDDIDPEAVADYRKSRAEVSPEAEELRWSDTDLLRALNCLRKDSTGLRPTVAGILLFGKTQALRRLFPLMRVDYIRVPGREWVSDPENRFESLDMRGSLFQLIRRAQATVLDDMPVPFRLPEGALQRTETPLIPARVIREAIVNAVMHRSYRTHSAIQLIRYANRLEIRNPGYSLKAEELLGEPGSLARNPTIAAVLHETRFAETKGSGIGVMRDLMRQNNLSPPLFESQRAEDRFVATFLFHHFLSEEDWHWLGRFGNLNLTTEEAKALIFVREVGAITNAAYRNMNMVDTLDASTHLRRLRDEGMLEQRGKGSATYYVPTDFLLRGQAPQACTSSIDAVETQEVLEKTQEVLEKTQEVSEQTQEVWQKRQVVTPNEDTMPESSPTSAASASDLISTFPSHVREALSNLGGWRSKPSFRALIKELCKERPLNAETIAHLTQRKQDYLVRTYLSPMVATGELAYTIPSLPQHPDQAYRTVTTIDASKATEANGQSG